MKYGWVLSIVFNIILFAVVTIYYRSGIGLAPPMGDRFLWVLIFIPLTALGFWLGILEGDALSAQAPGHRRYRVWTLLIGLLPFYLYTVLLISLSSVSGVLSSLIGLVILAIGFMQAEITRRLTGNALLSAILQAILIYWLILPSGALFTPMNP
jgi:hypothetical protein